VAVIQARLGSQRFPRKVLSELGDRPALKLLLDRLSRTDSIDEIILAIPDTSENDALDTWAREIGVRVFRGSENDVLARFHGAASHAGAEVAVRITGDCPFVDPELVDQVTEPVIEGRVRYAATDNTFPDGLDTEVFDFALLDSAHREATESFDREHVTPFIRRAAESVTAWVSNSKDLSDIRLTLDERADLEVLRGVLDRLGRTDFSLLELMDLIDQSPELFTGNAHIGRNEGASMSTGEKLWKRAKAVIPGGNMLLSKRSEMFLPSGWPSYFSRAAGCRVWDLDDREFIDTGLFGVGTNILGYGHPAVDSAVLGAVRAGNMSTFNCPEEVYLAERLIELHPWAGMVRFARSGGEICAVAARIGRAHSGKSTIAFSGYHGWHDWYLAANLSEDAALDGHLLPGLAPRGVPRGLAGSAKPFNYNDIGQLETILDEGDVGVIYMEVRRSSEPEPGFLEGVRALADQHGAVLIFDECTSGFRRHLGGLHLGYGVEPDIATFGKTLGNGYAITAAVGRADIMQAAQETFISSTFWTERIGPTAALATLDAMQNENAPERIDAIGTRVQATWIDLGRSHGLDLRTGGLPSLATFSISGLDTALVKTYITQEMLKRGFIAGTAMYSSIAHTSGILDRYFEEFEQVLKRLSAAGNDEDLSRLLPDGACQTGFTRLA
jgi:glutamate-1-semialdehyde aminotransferase/spore coat polysaccharide biosynthesis protein SpsF (cytidylyltransferase family)